MHTYAAVISYDGVAFSGWQKQTHAASVQEDIEKALQSVCGNVVTVTAAGRTDAGVHGKGQVISFSLTTLWDLHKLVLAINFYLPETVRVMRVFLVDNNFSARFCALWREYRYYIWHGPAFPPCLSQRAWWNRWYWNKSAVEKACLYLRGTHDFKAFCPIKECPENTVRSILSLKYRNREHLSVLTIRGNAFLMNMVRSIVGSLDLVGKEKKSAEWIKELLDDNKNRTHAGMTAPAHGLYFWRVGYDVHHFLPIPEISKERVKETFVPSDFA